MPCIPNSTVPVPPDRDKEEREKMDGNKYRFSGSHLPLDNQKDNVEANLLYWSQPSFWANRAVTYSNIDMR
jgi:hypothetical protein